ncbi:FAD-binding dehydrogenase [Streptomyces formicae]|uniref:FAD-binding dehydrogenase n=1 Tax=Streptomyces formicae TaxID=1616117 RepID=A0ABY3WP01_9ACTN|nr:FAD-binding dehydrogenase [Streptomyces formicae]UNM13855.1 FAD-binding dehydrogenase [Streptomyces formicae]
MDADVIVVGAGLAGLVATAELADAGRKVLLIEQESEANLGGQAHWSLGGLFFVDSPEQRRMGIKDSVELAWQDWEGTAGFDRPEDAWPRQWARAYVDFAAGEKRTWLRSQGVRFFPVVGWAERGGYGALGPGNSVPRFHVTWGTGPGVVEPFARRVREAVAKGLVTVRFRHRVDDITLTDGTVTGVAGTVLEPAHQPRGEATSRTATGTFELSAQAVVVASGGIGGNHELVRRNWPSRLGSPPRHMVAGVPAYVDGRMLGIAEKTGASVINADRMWHYTEGLKNWNPIWPQHGIRILPGPSSLWLDATGKRLPVPLYPGFDTMGTLHHLRSTGHDHSWFITTQKIIEKEFTLSGSEQNPDLTGKSIRQVVGRARGGALSTVEDFKKHGEDFVVADHLDDLVGRMNGLTEQPLLDPAGIRREIVARDRELANPYTKDGQIMAVHNARRFLGDRLIRTAPPHRLLDPKAGPLIGVRLHIVTRKSLGGLHTDLDGQVLKDDGTVLRGLYAAGEASGFGGGGLHGYRALEGTFLGGCLFSGRQAGRAAARATA